MIRSRFLAFAKIFCLIFPDPTQISLKVLFPDRTNFHIKFATFTMIDMRTFKSIFVAAARTTNQVAAKYIDEYNKTSRTRMLT
jgi:hypothetical protein